MFGILDLPAFLIGTFAIVLLPGPNSMYCLTVAGTHGVKTAYRSIGGILLGDSILMLCTVLGAGTLLKLYPALFHGIKLAGGLYLAYIGWNLLRAAGKKWHIRRPEPQAATPTAQPAVPQHVFRRSLLLSLTNPKAILFFLSFFVQFADPDYPRPWLTFLLLAVILQIISFSYLSALAAVGSKLVEAFRQHMKISAVAMALVGIMFISFAVKLWTAVM